MRKTYLERAVQAESAAQRELARVPDFIWDGKELPVPIEAITDSHYGLLVREEDRLAALAGLPGGHVSGMLVAPAREIWVDGVEAHVAPARKRFTLGHEVGHWVLHCGSGLAAAPGAPPYCRTETVQEEAEADDEAAASAPRRRPYIPYPIPEHEANHFGAAMLMPRALVVHEYEWCSGDVANMAREFAVSQRAMELRLRFLKLAGP